jgi:phosphatidylinositol alpha-mannosyltransferase
MRIALTHAYSWPEVRRGAERFLPSLAAALVRRGHEVIHYSAAWSAGTSTEEGVRTIRLRRVFRDQPRHEADFGRRLLPRLALGRFDAVHALGRSDALASVRAARLHQSTTTVFTDMGLPNPASWAYVGRHEARTGPKVVKGVEVYSGMSQCAVDYLVRYCGREDGVVIPGGVDLDSFAPSSARAPSPTILFSGAIAEQRKGVPLLLEALPLIAEREPEVELWLSGPGDAEPFLAEAPAVARERTKLLGLGDAEDQPEHYGRTWITCLPSVKDSFGMALLESLACGTPLVATTDSAPKELVEVGATGELCDPENPRSLAEACLRGFRLARDPATVERCRSSAQAYDWDEGLAPLCEALYRGDPTPPMITPPLFRSHQGSTVEPVTGATS